MQTRIHGQLVQLRENPFARGAKKLRKEQGFRVAVGAYRIVYWIDSPKQEVTVTRISHRREAYR